MEVHYVEGTVTMEVDDPEAACKDDTLMTAFKGATAGLAGGSADDVEATCSVATRRLGSESRRLAGSIEFKYRIAMASEEAASKLMSAIAAAPVEDLTKLINAALPADHPYAIEVTGKSEPSMIVVTLTTTTTAEVDEERRDSHARTPVAFGSFAIALIAASFSQ